MNEQHIASLNERFRETAPELVIRHFAAEFRGRIALSSSLGAEDQILTHMLASIDKDTRIFTLDTGRLFPETYDLIEKTNRKYGVHIEVYFPDARQVEDMVREKGINLFYESVEYRKLCCHIRKIELLQRAFKGLDAWICGLRREQSITRTDNQLIEWDSQHNLLKINPLIEWTELQVWEYIRMNGVPYNPLHDKGYASIGCQPCTRAIEPGEDTRSGRWWWENPDHKECGLHRKH
jgi:phosphoadenosine phosphosulfate reductase